MTTKPKQFLWKAILLTISYNTVVGVLIAGYLVQGIDRPLLVLLFPWMSSLSLLGKAQRSAHTIWVFRGSNLGLGLASLARIWAGFSPTIFYPFAIILIAMTFLPLSLIDKFFKPRT